MAFLRNLPFGSQTPGKHQKTHTYRCRKPYFCSLLSCLWLRDWMFLWILCMSAAGLMMYTFIYLCADINWKDAAYYTIRAFVIAEFVASCEWQVDLFFQHSKTPPTPLISILILIVCYEFFLPYANAYITVISQRNSPLILQAGSWHPMPLSD